MRELVEATISLEQLEAQKTLGIAAMHKRELKPQGKALTQKQINGLLATIPVKQTLDISDDERALLRALTKPLYEKIAESAKALTKRLTGIKHERLAEVLGYWIGKTPYQEREDILQSLCLAMLDNQPSNVKLAFAVARGYVCNWWDAYHVRQHIGLETPVYGAEGEITTLSNTLVGVCEIERIEGALDAETLWKSLPEDIRRIVNLKLSNPKRLTVTEKTRLADFAKANGNLLMQ